MKQTISPDALLVLGGIQWDCAYKVGQPVLLPPEPKPEPSIKLSVGSALHVWDGQLTGQMKALPDGTAVPLVLAQVYRRDSLRKHTHVANIILADPSMSTETVMEFICQALDNEFKTRPERSG